MFKILITKADACEYKKDYKNAKKYLKAALKFNQAGSVSRKDVELRIKELDEKI